MEFEENLDSPKFKPNKIIKTYGKTSSANKNVASGAHSSGGNTKVVEELTTKNAVSFLLAGTLTSKVCKYCLNVTEELYELGKTVEIASKSGLYSVTVQDMIASFHPFKVADDSNFPNKICDKCLNRTISSYLFTQQCEQSERAIANCFEDIYTKLSHLDPIEGPKDRRGRRKKHPNHNVIKAEYVHVVDYADPIMHIVNTNSESLTTEPKLNPLECLKCCQVLPDIESLSNHSKTHPKSMWFNCRLCGKSFPRLNQVKRHYREHVQYNLNKTDSEKQFECKQCGETNEKYHEHIRHLEKHKFKIVVDHLVHGTMDKLCSVCLDKGNLVPLDKLVSIHGGPPDLMGDRTMQSILASTLAEMNFPNNYTGSKICETCVNNAITSYVFMTNTYFVRDRLNMCISHMLDNLKDISTEKNLCIEIAKNTVMPMKEPVDESIFDPNLIKDDIKEEVFLEDEYRVQSEDEIETETDSKSTMKWQVQFNDQESNKVSKIKSEPVNEEKYMNGYQMDVCSEFLTFKKKPKLQKLIKKFTCPICSKHFLSDYFVKQHILKHTSKKVKCSPCGTVFGSRFSLNEHTKYAHVLFQSDYRACKTCGRGFAKADRLKQHEKQHRNILCLLCDKVFKTQTCYNVHMRRHIPKLILLKKKYGQSCSFCEKVCSNENQLSLHVNKVHLQIKPYSCDMCETKFYTEYNLRFHKKVHSKYSKEKCNFCSKTLKSRKLLVIHIRKHIGAMPHICQICNQSFYSQSNLKQHMVLTHGGTFLCKICKHVSISKNDLKLHVNNVHSFL